VLQLHGFAVLEYSACRPLPAYCHLEQIMSINKDQVKGLVKQVEGNVKEAAGKLVGNEKLEAKGKVEKIVGKAQVKAGDLKEHVKDAIDKV
jgi:uncharacterized protein YjbJ (UPF0337 family)